MSADEIRVLSRLFGQDLGKRSSGWVELPNGCADRGGGKKEWLE